MLNIDELVTANRKFLEDSKNDPRMREHLTSHPKKKLAIVTCMDTRLVDMLERALGYTRGEIIVIKTAGNSVTNPFDSVVQSLLVAVYGMEVEDVLVIGHEECGMIDFSSQSFIQKMVAAGINRDAIRMIETGLIDWMDKFCVSEHNVLFTVDRLKKHPLFPAYMHFYGGMMDPATGEIRMLSVESQENQ